MNNHQRKAKADKLNHPVFEQDLINLLVELEATSIIESIEIDINTLEINVKKSNDELYRQVKKALSHYLIIKNKD